MPRISIGKHIHATREEVFAVVSDIENAPRNIVGIEEVEMLTEGPLGVGTKFRERRMMFGREAAEELTVTSYDPPNGYVVECESGGVHFRTEFLLIPDISGTHLRVVCDATPRTIVAKVVFPIAMFTSDITSKCIDSVLCDIKKVAEAAAQPVVHS